MKKANFLWSLFSSVKLAITLLCFIIFIFIVATLVPQQNVSPAIAWLSDLYHSKAFYILTGLFSLNLVICSINRWSVSMKQFNTPCFPAPSGIFNNLSQNRIILTDKKIEDVERVVQTFLSSKIKKVQTTDMENGRLFCREKGRFSLFGVYIVHLGVLVIIAGAVIGSIFGFDADINLSEGQESNIVQLVKDKGTRELDFLVRCDKFTVEFYETGAPKSYRSDLSFIKGGQVIHQGSALVNHPVTFEGLRFYQSSYGLAEEKKAYLTYVNSGVESDEIVVVKGSTFNLPAQNAKATVLRVEENMMQFGPAVKLNIETKKGNIQFWVFQHIKEIAEVNPGLLSSVPFFNPGLFKPFVFSLKNIERQYYTGLHVVRDPGVPFVLGGGLMLMAGMMIIFFFSHQRIWTFIEQDPKGIKISMAGHSNRYNEALQRKIDNLSRQIKMEMTA